MNTSHLLTPKYNLAWGFSPAIFSMLLSAYTSHQTAIYWGTVIGVVLSLRSWNKRHRRIPYILLYATTCMLALLTIFHLFFHCTCPSYLGSFVVEVSLMLPSLLILFNQKRLQYAQLKGDANNEIHLFRQGIEASIVSSRIFVMVVTIHLLSILITLFLQYPIEGGMQTFLFNVAPFIVYGLTIFINQLCIWEFNKMMQYTIFLPIVNKYGDVIGKCLPSDSQGRYIHPIIRIAVSIHGMLLLRRRSAHSLLDKGKTDILIEGFLTFGETLEEGAKRMISYALPDAPQESLRYNLSYYTELQGQKRLIYLFTLCLPDESCLKHQRFSGSKLWTFKQIEHNLKQHFFSQHFEYEYQQLKSIILTRTRFNKEKE